MGSPDLGKLARIAFISEVAGTWNKRQGTACDTLLPASDFDPGKSELQKSRPAILGEAWLQNADRGEYVCHPTWKFKRFTFAGFERLIAAVCGAPMITPVQLSGTTAYRHVYYPKKYNSTVCTFAAHGGVDPGGLGDSAALLQEIPSVVMAGMKFSCKDGNDAMSFDCNGVGNLLLNYMAGTGSMTPPLGPTNTFAGLNALAYRSQGVIDLGVMLWMADYLSGNQAGYTRIGHTNQTLTSSFNVRPRGFEFNYDAKIKGQPVSGVTVETPAPDGVPSNSVMWDFAAYNGPAQENAKMVEFIKNIQAYENNATPKHYQAEMLFVSPQLAGTAIKHQMKFKFPKIDLSVDDPKFSGEGVRPTKAHGELLQPEATPTGMTMYNTENAPWEIEITTDKSTADDAT